jgi:hypothetical protein
MTPPPVNKSFQESMAADPKKDTSGNTKPAIPAYSIEQLRLAAQVNESVLIPSRKYTRG